MSFYLPMVLLISSVLVYQISQKLIPKDINSWHVLFFVYVIGAGLCLLMGLLEQKVTFWQSLKASNFSVITLAISVVGIELGFLLALRAGWPLSRTGITANVTVALLVIPIGLLFFKERLHSLNLVGILLCVLGLILVVRR
jgi:uncharacterized membrane protein